ncbi:hypothetical protein V5O48_001365 [Marasmius crinis-equi]|uniref:Alpha/gamma-adaptin-binding protein p34 n=1 Tax=Marasmius crinis-equi TaxID=585013 RepID=A0ABR3FZS4_9AGAR
MLSSEPSCRILTVASTLERAVTVVEQIQALSSSTQSVTDSSEGGEDPSGSENGRSIPWTISNKYYSADVHFWARPIKGLAPHHLQEVPAVIFAWEKGKDLKGHDPEISLAIRLPLSNSSNETKGEEEDDDEKAEEVADTDEFLSEHGFEFIDVLTADEGEDDSMRDGVPSLPRVLDALSTIMWPSMQASGKASRGKANARTAALLDWAQSSGDDSSLDFPSDDELVVARSSGGNNLAAIRQKKEMAELTRWLEEDDASKNDPWKLAAGIVHSPTTDDDERADDYDPTTPMPTFDRFDDDFTVFVSAPPAPHVETQSQGNASPLKASPTDDDGRLSPSFTGSSFNTEKLVPSYSGVTYHSLGSHPDLSDMGPDSAAHSDNGSDDGLPTEEEVQKSAEKIFGATFAGASSSRLPSDMDAHREGDGDDYEMTPFDLSHVMSALQGMKAEIAAIDDEQERRKAAARVALGLVYGLEAQEGGENEN